MKFLEEKFVPFAAKVGAQKHLACIRDTFVLIMPLTIAGAVGVLLNCIGQIFAKNGLNMPTVQAGYESFIKVSGLSNVFTAMNAGTISIMAILLAGILSGKLTEANGGDGQAAIAVGIACFLSGLTIWGISPGEDPKAAYDTFTKLIGANGLFVAMLMAIFVGEVFPRLSKNKHLIIKMPDGVPPAVSKAFSSLIPAILTVGLAGIIYGYTFKFSGRTVFEIIEQFLGAPLKGLSQSVGMVIIMYFMIDLLWVFGLHGANIVGAVTTPVLTPLGLENMNRFANKQEPLNTVTAGLQSGFAFMGGSGATLGALLAIMLFSKSAASKTIANLAFAPGLFEINEPLTFGLPIVMNMVLAIPFILGPIVLGVITYYLMEAGMIRRPCIDAPWVTPPVLVGFLCTGGDFRGAVWNVIEIVLLTILWTPFILMNDKVQARENS